MDMTHQPVKPVDMKIALITQTPIAAEQKSGEIKNKPVDMKDPKTETKPRTAKPNSQPNQQASCSPKLYQASWADNADIKDDLWLLPILTH